MEEGKVRHIRRDPRVNLVVANADWPYKGVEIRTEARLTTDGFYDVLRRTADRYLGPGSGDETAPRYEPGVVIRVEPGVVRAWDYTDEVSIGHRTSDRLPVRRRAGDRALDPPPVKARHDDLDGIARRLPLRVVADDRRPVRAPAGELRHGRDDRVVASLAHPTASTIPVTR